MPAIWRIIFPNNKGTVTERRMPPAFTWLKSSAAASLLGRSATRGLPGLMPALILALCLPAFAQDLPRLQGTVTRVLDGDTIDVELASGPIRVRLNGIDAPEKNQPMGAEATLTLSKLVNSKTVLLEPFEQDKYDRMIATVYLGDRNINVEMVTLGYAWAYRRYMKSANRELCSLEFAARKAHLGIWSRPTSDWIAP
jgi:endonuclease YncB( thermonuclease family)